MRLIDADDFYNDLMEIYRFKGYEEKEIHFLLRDIKMSLIDAPTIDAEPVRHGEWEFVYEDTNEELIFECSLCKGFSTRENFCPHCGARMDAKEEEE